MRRKRQPEVMDQPDLDPSLHAAALRGLRRINWISRSSAILWPAIRELAQSRSSEQLRLLDLATGGGDIPIDLWRRARRAGLKLQVHACDRSDFALDQARRLAKQRGADVCFFAHDALGEEIPEDYDIVVCSLFLHHFEPSDAVTILRHMALARRLVLVNDLRRGVDGWLLAWAGARILTRCPVVHTDGPLSVAGAYTCAEALGLARDAGLTGATVRRRWPCRWLLKWQRN
jgi:2-polyprenyl-3-methyl-5-hydroxy-6-metoxy-1,4-benzoquinol methylase